MSRNINFSNNTNENQTSDFETDQMYLSFALSESYLNSAPNKLVDWAPTLAQVCRTHQFILRPPSTYLVNIVLLVSCYVGRL